MPRSQPLLPNLTVAQLEYLDAVGRHTTWSEAAESLGVSPSALSQGLAELERRIGVTLFERVGRRRIVRPQASPVTDHAWRVVAQTRDLAAWAERIRVGHEGTLRVGMIDAAAVTHFPRVLRSFRRQRPGVELLLTVAPSADLLDLVDQGDLDVVVCVRPPGDPAATWIITPLLDEPLAIYAPDGAPSDDAAAWGPWVTFPEGSHTRTLIAGALAAMGAGFEVVAVSHQPEVLAEMVRLGMGWTVLPVAQAEARPRPLVPTRPEPLTTRQLVAVHRADSVLNPAAVALLAALTPP